MKAQKFDIRLLPNLPESVVIFKVRPQDFGKLESVGGQKVEEKKHSATFNIPLSLIEQGEMWVGFDAPANANNHFVVGGLDIKTWSSGMLFAEIEEISGLEA